MPFVDISSLPYLLANHLHVCCVTVCHLAASGDSSEAKKACGMHTSKLRMLKSLISSPGLLTQEQLEQRTYQLPKDFAEKQPQGSATQAEMTVNNKDSNKKNRKRARQHAPTDAADVQQMEACIGVQQVSENNITCGSSNDQHADDITDERLADVLKAVVDKFGSGTPPIQQDPAFITCFVALPGRSGLKHRLQPRLDTFNIVQSWLSGVMPWTVNTSLLEGGSGFFCM